MNLTSVRWFILFIFASNKAFDLLHNFSNLYRIYIAQRNFCCAKSKIWNTKVYDALQYEIHRHITARICDVEDARKERKFFRRSEELYLDVGHKHPKFPPVRE